MIQSDTSKIKCIFLIAILLYVPFILIRISSLLHEMSSGFGFPNVWTPSIRSIVAIVCLVFLTLPWVFNYFIHKEIKKKQLNKSYNYKESILIIGLACTTVPALSGFFLFQFGGPLNEVKWFAWTSVVGGAIWSAYSLTTYLKKPANPKMKADD